MSLPARISQRFSPEARLSDRTLLAVVAHANDETFIMGGTLARYAAEGVSVHLLLTTCGDLAGNEARRSELDRAAKALGLAGYSTLDYGESGMTWDPRAPSGESQSYLSNANPAEIVQRIAAEIRRVRPQVIVTFDSTGVYGHPDHIVTGRATLLAFDRTRDLPDGPKKLYAAVFGRRLFKWGIRGLRAVRRDPRRFGPQKDIDLVTALRQAPPPTSYVEVARYLPIRRQAVRCHRSQISAVPVPQRCFELLPPRVRGRFFPREVFACLHPHVDPLQPEDDLFAGMD